MSEVSRNLREVRMLIAPDDLSDLLSLLGGFAAQRTMHFEVTAPSAICASDKHQESRIPSSRYYNPLLVRTIEITKADGIQRLNLITKKGLQSYTEGEGTQARDVCKYAMKSLAKAYAEHPEILEPYVAVSRKDNEHEDSVVGVHADRIEELVSRLNCAELTFPMSQASRELLSRAARDLYTEAPFGDQ